jgi:hypothetical protein
MEEKQEKIRHEKILIPPLPSEWRIIDGQALASISDIKKTQKASDITKHSIKRFAVERVITEKCYQWSVVFESKEMEWNIGDKCRTLSTGYIFSCLGYAIVLKSSRV